jgi:hypothetical protein
MPTEVERLRAEVRRLLEERDDARRSVVDLTTHIGETMRRGARGDDDADEV